MAAVAGAFGGVFLKQSGDFLYDNSRSAWINYRRTTLEQSRPRRLSTTPKHTISPSSQEAANDIIRFNNNLSPREEFRFFSKPKESISGTISDESEKSRNLTPK